MNNVKSFFSKLKTSSKDKKTNLNLEYLIILRKSGLPIYSKCWGNFCAVLTVDDTLLSGFLSAVTSMPTMFNQKTELSAVEMGFSKLLFNYTTPNGHIICGGFRREEINDRSMKVINNFFTQIEQFMEEDYSNQDWDDISDEVMKDFEGNLMNKIVQPWFHTASTVNHTDDGCPFCSTGKIYRGEANSGLKETFSVRLSNLYGSFKAKILHYPQFADKKEENLKIREKVNKRANIEN